MAKTDGATANFSWLASFSLMLQHQREEVKAA